MSNTWIGPTRNWEPDRRITLALTALGAVLALWAFASLLRQPAAPNVEPDRVSLLLRAAVTQKPPARKPERRTPSVRKPSIAVKRVQPVIPMYQSAPDRLDLSVPPLPSSAPAFLEPKATGADRNLARTLNAQRKPSPDLQDGNAYRSASGETVVKSDGECVRVQQIQMSPSPTNKATIGFLAHCPGEYRLTLGDKLLKWAEKKQNHLQPPR